MFLKNAWYVDAFSREVHPSLFGPHLPEREGASLPDVDRAGTRRGGALSRAIETWSEDVPHGGGRHPQLGGRFDIGRST